MLDYLLTEEQQAIQDANLQAQQGLANTAADRADFLEGYLPGTEALTDEIDSKLYDWGAERLDPANTRGRQRLGSRL